MKRPLGFFLLAGLAAMLAAVVVFSALKKREAEVRRALVQSVDVVVAARDLPLGAKVDGGAVKLARWSRDAIPPGAFTSLPGPVGAVVKSSFVENEPIVANKLFTGDKTAGVMPLLIPAGMRAMSVAVDEVSDIAGFVLPHSHVDVLVAVTGGQSGDQQRAFSKVVLQDIEVLAVAQEIERSKDEPELVHVVTFLLTPDDAERLTLASHEGSLRLAMRSFDDNKIVLTRGADMNEILRAYGGGAPLAPLARQNALDKSLQPRPKSDDVEILRNGKSAESISFIDQTGQAALSAPKSPAAAPDGAPVADSANAASAPVKPSLAQSKTEPDPKTATAAAAAESDDDDATDEDATSAPDAPSAKREAALMPNPKVIDIP